MRTLDIFTGIGGFSLGLQDYCQTVGYCEIDPMCVKVLEDNMRAGRLRKAPVHNDVTTLAAKELSQLRPIMLTAGSPCQDISCVNTKGKGVDGPKSKLVFEIFRIVEAAPSIRCVLMENSSCIQQRGMDRVLKWFVKHNWSVAWSVFGAAEVGALHSRKRWFCLATAPGFDLKVKHKAWTQGPKTVEPKRVILAREPIAKRCGLLGNAVVPACAKLAFTTLAQFIAGDAGAVKSPDTALRRVCVKLGNDTKWTDLKRSFVNRSPPQDLVFIQGDVVYKRDGWSTARKTSTVYSRGRVLNDQAMMMLGTQVLYEKVTKRQIRELVGAFDIEKVHINPTFVEWLMMFPKGWTRSAASTHGSGTSRHTRTNGSSEV